MAWPNPDDYYEAVQNPQTCFADPDLRTGQVFSNAQGLPLPWSGNFADVYRVDCARSQRTWAVKCFTREVVGLARRYAVIADWLKQVKLPFTVDFQYLEQGIRVHGRSYPVLKMDWVKGQTLNEFVREQLDKPHILDAVGKLWVKLSRRLREARLAHADIQHGNVLLVPVAQANSVHLKLIDYDGMFVPALANNKSGELGHPAYQHPQRLRAGIYSAEVDRFPHLVIYTALQCLKVAGSDLWQYDNGDNLLFRVDDFDNPGKSAIFHALWELKDHVAHRLVGHLILATQAPLDGVPLLHDLANNGSVAPLTVAQEKQVDALLAGGASGARQASRLAVSATVDVPATPTGTGTAWRSPGTGTMPSPLPGVQSQIPQTMPRIRVSMPGTMVPVIAPRDAEVGSGCRRCVVPGYGGRRLGHDFVASFR